MTQNSNVALSKKMIDTAGKFSIESLKVMNSIRDSIFKGKFATTIISILIVCLIAVMSWQAYNYLTKEDVNCNKIKRHLDRSFHNTDPIVGFNYITYGDQPLVNFYINSAYNCCAQSTYRQGYVSKCALIAVLNKKVRCLDFEIYDVKDEPVIATSDSNSFNYKGSYNYLTVEDVFKNIIAPLAFKSDKTEGTDFKGVAGCATDPLFLNLRIKTKHITVIDKLGKYIVKYLGDRLLGPDFNYTRPKGQQFGAIVLMNDLKAKIVIMVVMEDGLIENSNQFAQVVNIYTTYNTTLASGVGSSSAQSGGANYITLRSNQVQPDSFGSIMGGSGAGGLLTSYTLVMVMPKLSYDCKTFNTFGDCPCTQAPDVRTCDNTYCGGKGDRAGQLNSIFLNGTFPGGFGSAGVQFIAPCFQSGGGDGALFKYLVFFKQNRASIVKKDDSLCQDTISYGAAEEVTSNQTLSKARPVGGEGGKLFHSVTGVTGL